MASYGSSTDPRSPLYGTATFSTLSTSQTPMSPGDTYYRSNTPLASSDSEGASSERNLRRVALSPGSSARHSNTDSYTYSDEDSIRETEEVEAALTELDRELDNAEDALTEWSRGSSSRLSGTASGTTLTYTTGSLDTYPLDRDRRVLSTISERTENIPSRPTSYSVSSGAAANPNIEGHKRSTHQNGAHSPVLTHSRSSTESGLERILPGRRAGDLIAFFEDKVTGTSETSFGHSRAASTPGYRSTSPFLSQSQSTPGLSSIPGYGYGSRASSPTKSRSGSALSSSGSSMSGPLSTLSLLSPPARTFISNGSRLTGSGTYQSQSPSDFTSTLTHTPTNSTILPTANGHTTANGHAATPILTPVSSSLRRPQTSPRSPLTSVRNIVAAWKERTPSLDKTGKSSTESVSAPSGGDGLFSLRRRAERGENRLRERAMAGRTSPEVLTINGNAYSATPKSVKSGSSSVVPPPFDLAEFGAYARDSREPLRHGSLWYLNVHSGPPYVWVRCQALLYPHMLLLSWIATGGGRGIITLDLLNCTEVRSVPSPRHKSARDDVGTIAAKEQDSKDDSYSLMDLLCPFQLLYSDGVERLAAESARERVRWVSAIWEALDRSVTLPDRSDTRSPTGSIRTIRSITSSTSTRSGTGSGSASTVFVPPLQSIPDLSDLESLSRASSNASLSIAPPPLSAHGTRATDDAAVSNQTFLYPGDRRAIGPSRSSSLRRTSSMTDLDQEFASAVSRARNARPGLGFGLSLVGGVLLGDGSPVTVSSGPRLGADVRVTPPPSARGPRSRPHSVISDEAFFTSGSHASSEDSKGHPLSFYSFTSASSGDPDKTTTGLITDETAFDITSGGSNTHIVPSTLSYRRTESASYLGDSHDGSYSYSGASPSRTSLSRSSEVRRRRRSSRGTHYTDGSSDKENSGSYTPSNTRSTLSSLTRSRSVTPTPTPSSYSSSASRSDERSSEGRMNPASEYEEVQTTRSPSTASFESLPSIPSESDYVTAETCRTEVSTEFFTAEKCASDVSTEYITAETCKTETETEYFTAELCKSEPPSEYETASVCKTIPSEENTPRSVRLELPSAVMVPLPDSPPVILPPISSPSGQVQEVHLHQTREEESANITEIIMAVENLATAGPQIEHRVDATTDTETRRIEVREVETHRIYVTEIETVDGREAGARDVDIRDAETREFVSREIETTAEDATLSRRVTVTEQTVAPENIPLPLSEYSPSIPSIEVLDVAVRQEETATEIHPPLPTVGVPQPDGFSEMSLAETSGEADISPQQEFSMPSPSVRGSLWAPETDASFDSSLLQPTPSVQSVSLQDVVDISFETSFLRPSMSPLTSLERLTPISATIMTSTLSVLSLPSMSSSSLSRTPSSVSDLSSTSVQSASSLIPTSPIDASIPAEPSTEPSLLSTHRTPASERSVSPLMVPVPASPSLPPASVSMSVSLSTPHSDIPSIHSNLETILPQSPSDAVAHDIDRLLEHIDHLDLVRGQECQEMSENIREIRDELFDLSNFLRQRGPFDIPPPVPRKDRSVGGSTVLSSRGPTPAGPRPPIPLTPPPLRPPSPSSLSSTMSFLSSHHSDDLSLMESESYPVQQRSLAPPLPPPSQSPPSSPSYSASEPSSEPSSSGSYIDPSYTRSPSSLPLPPPPSPTPSAASSRTIRPMEVVGLNSLRELVSQIREQTDALWEGQISTNHMLDELRQQRLGPFELDERLRNIESLLDTILSQAQRPSEAPPATEFADSVIGSTSDPLADIESLRQRYEELSRSRPEQPHIHMPTPVRTGPSLDDPLLELLGAPPTLPTSTVQPPPPLIPFTYHPAPRPPRSRSASPVLLPERPDTFPIPQEPIRFAPERTIRIQRPRRRPAPSVTELSEFTPRVVPSGPDRLRDEGPPSQPPYFDTVPERRPAVPPAEPVIPPLYGPSDRAPSAPADLGGTDGPRFSSSWYRPRRTNVGPVPPPGFVGPSDAPEGRTYVPMPPGPTVVQVPLFDTLMEILREHRLAQLATVDQQRELMRYMQGLNEWLERDVHDRQSELRGVSARVDQLRSDLGRLLGREPGSQVFPSGVPPPGFQAGPGYPLVPPVVPSQQPVRTPPPQFPPVIPGQYDMPHPQMPPFMPPYPPAPYGGPAWPQAPPAEPDPVVPFPPSDGSSSRASDIRVIPPAPGFPQPGFPQPGFPQPGFPQPGFPQPGFPQPGFPQPGFPQPGYLPITIDPPAAAPEQPPVIIARSPSRSFSDGPTATQQSYSPRSQAPLPVPPVTAPGPAPTVIPIPPSPERHPAVVINQGPSADMGARDMPTQMPPIIIQQSPAAGQVMGSPRREPTNIINVERSPQPISEMARPSEGPAVVRSPSLGRRPAYEYGDPGDRPRGSPPIHVSHEPSQPPVVIRTSPGDEGRPYQVPYSPRDEGDPHRRPRSREEGGPFPRPYSPRDEGDPHRRPRSREEGGPFPRPYSPRDEGDPHRRPRSREEGGPYPRPYSPRDEGGSRRRFSPGPGDPHRRPYSPRDEGGSPPPAIFRRPSDRYERDEGGRFPLSPQQPTIVRVAPSEHGYGEERAIHSPIPHVVHSQGFMDRPLSPRSRLEQELRRPGDTHVPYVPSEIPRPHPAPGGPPLEPVEEELSIPRAATGMPGGVAEEYPPTELFDRSRGRPGASGEEERDLPERPYSETSMVPVPAPRPTTGPDDTAFEDALRVRHQRLDDIQRDLELAAQTAAETAADNEKFRENAFRENEGERERIFLEHEDRREHEYGQRSDEIFRRIEERLAALPFGPGEPPVPVPEPTPAAEPAPSIIESLHSAAQDAASRHAASLREIVEHERETFARDREQERLAREEERARFDEGRETHIRTLEEELARVRAELENEKQQRQMQEAAAAEREGQEAAQRDAAINGQLGEMTNLIQDQREMCAQKKQVMDDRWEEMTRRHDAKNEQLQQLKDMVTKLVEDGEAERMRAEEERAAAEAKPGIQQVLDELARQNQEQRELLNSISESWRSDSARQHEETINAVRATAQEQVPFNVQGYLDDFSRALASEVRMLLSEVGRLREERRNIHHELGYLLSMRAKYGPGGEFDPEWKPTMPGPSAPPSEPPPPPPEPPAPEEPHAARPAWRTIPTRTRRLRRPGGPAGQPPQPPQPPPQPDPRSQVTSWATWQPDPRLQPTPPTVEPTLLVPDTRSPGLFGPRSPHGSFRG